MIIVNRLFEEKTKCFERIYKTFRESGLVGEIKETPVKNLTKVTITFRSKDLYNVKQFFPDAELITNN